MARTQCFQLHPQLEEDCHVLGRFAVSHVLLHRNASLPWFIVVPETNAADMLDLEPTTREVVVEECAMISAYLKRTAGCSKVNFAAIGNLVAQMHLHVIGRTPGDSCWPLPVWGHLTEQAAYESDQVARVRSILERDYDLARS